jgi:hypothetical protein
MGHLATQSIYKFEPTQYEIKREEEVDKLIEDANC